MKRFTATFLTALAGGSAAFAHQMEGGSTEGLFGLKAEYVHVLLNPLLVYGLATGVLALLGGLLARSTRARVIGLLLIVLCSAAAWPTFYYGQHGYNHLYPQIDTESQQWLDVHMDRAERFIYAFYATTILSIAALIAQKKPGKAAAVFTALTLASAILSVGIGGWISRAGGQVSHSEFRAGEAPTNAPAHQHHYGNNEQTGNENK